MQYKIDKIKNFKKMDKDEKLNKLNNLKSAQAAKILYNELSNSNEEITKYITEKYKG